MEPIAMPKVTVGGVPEHFNLPWYTAVENKEFEAAGVQVDFEEVPGGTGAMMSALREGKIDIVVALTEGIISNIINDDKREVCCVTHHLLSFSNKHCDCVFLLALDCFDRRLHRFTFDLGY